MTTLHSFVTGGSAFPMPSVEQFLVHRPLLIADDTNPDAVVDSGEYAEHTVYGYLSSSTTSEATDPVRRTATSTAQLVIPDPTADVKRGDRITHGDRTWTVQGFTQHDTNPFTGWQPTLVASLEEVIG